MISSAGSLEASAGKDSTTVTLNVVKKDLQHRVRSDVRRRCCIRRFSDEELDRQRQQLLSNLEVQYSDPELSGVRRHSAAHFMAAHLTGWPDEGTPDTVKKLDREDLVKFHDANYAPNQSLLALCRRHHARRSLRRRRKIFWRWPKLRRCRRPRRRRCRRNLQAHIWLIDKPDAVQTQIRVGKIAHSPRRSGLSFRVDVTNRIFGGGYNSRLNTEVRVKKGLTYGAYSSFTPHRFTGSLAVGTYTRTEATVEATKLVVDLLTEMSTGEITQKELDFARDYLAGVYPIESETAEQVADRVLTVAAFDLPADYNQTYPEKIRAYFAGASASHDGAANISPRAIWISCWSATSALFATR